MPTPRILIVEDDALIAMALELELAGLGYEVCGVAASAEVAFGMARQEHPDVVLMDMRLKGHGDGVDAAKAMHDEGLAAKIIFVTGSRERETMDRIESDHPSGILIKPVGLDEVAEAIQSVI